MYRQNPAKPGESPEQETARLRAGKGEKGSDFSTACPMRSVVERKWKDIQDRQAQ